MAADDKAKEEASKPEVGKEAPKVTPKGRYRLLQGTHVLTGGVTIHAGQTFEAIEDPREQNLSQQRPRFERLDVPHAERHTPPPSPARSYQPPKSGEGIETAEAKEVEHQRLQEQRAREQQSEQIAPPKGEPDEDQPAEKPPTSVHDKRVWDPLGEKDLKQDR